MVVSGTTPSLNGITFPATQVASAGANTLDDYEEGTWTPQISSSGGGNGASTDGSGTYVKIGNMVYVQGYRVLTSKAGISAGNARITGLPFTATGSLPAAAFGTVDSMTIPAGQTYFTLGFESTYIRIRSGGTNTVSTDVTQTELTNTTGLLFSGAYITT
jgi:hypothetical protein